MTENSFPFCSSAAGGRAGSCSHLRSLCSRLRLRKLRTTAWMTTAERSRSFCSSLPSRACRALSMKHALEVCDTVNMFANQHEPCGDRRGAGVGHLCTWAAGGGIQQPPLPCHRAHGLLTQVSTPYQLLSHHPQRPDCTAVPRNPISFVERAVLGGEQV